MEARPLIFSTVAAVKLYLPEVLNEYHCHSKTKMHLHRWSKSEQEDEEYHNCHKCNESCLGAIHGIGDWSEPASLSAVVTIVITNSETLKKT